SRQLLGINLNHRYIALRIASHYFGCELAPILQCDFYLIGTIHHVIVGQNIAILRRDYARANTLLTWSAEVMSRRTPFEFIAEEAAEEIIHAGGTLQSGARVGRVVHFRGNEN